MTWNPDRENDSLRYSWERHDAEMLDSYMIADVEDPRIHCQSILTRALVADTLWPGEFTELIDAEQRFGVVMTWILQQFKAGAVPADLLDDVIDRKCPPYVAETHYWLPQQQVIPDYITLALQNSEAVLPEIALETFAALWRASLADREVETPLRVLEAACGSANDYRFLDSFGFAPFIDYAGFDISPTNIANAQERFPETKFFVASAFDTGLEDAEYDFVYTHDLFEHLSPDGLVSAVREIFRVTGKQAWLHFFNLSTTASEHEIVPLDDYHWNLLSLDRLKELFPEKLGDLQVIDIPDFLNNQFGTPDYYNAEAVTLLATK